MFTLFNLQGTFGCFDRYKNRLHRSFELSAELIHINTLETVCQELFSNSFLQFFVFCAALEAAYT